MLFVIDTFDDVSTLHCLNLISLNDVPSFLQGLIRYLTVKSSLFKIDFVQCH